MENTAYSIEFRAMAFAAVVIGLNALCSSIHAEETGEIVTFTRDVAPIFHARCIECHQPGEIAPMSLRTYREARPWASSIRRAVYNREMPPWHADPNYGEFSNDCRLSDDEINTIVAWVDQGARRGSRSDMPSAPERVDGWRLGPPDFIVESGEIEIPAEGPDMWRKPESVFEHPDRWVRAVEIQPSNRQVVHHAVVSYLNPAPDDVEEPEAGKQEFLGGWVAGRDPWEFPEGTGKLLKQGAQLRLNIHYHPSGEAAVDNTRIGIYFVDSVPKHEVVTFLIQDRSFAIPAGEGQWPGSASFHFAETSIILNMLPHMHFRGKDMRYVATYPDGRQEVLLSVPNYDFGWQRAYIPVEPLLMPKGTRLDILGHWDNSASNPNNPDPTQEVVWGRESTDEMFVGFIDYIAAEKLPSAETPSD